MTRAAALLLTVALAACGARTAPPAVSVAAPDAAPAAAPDAASVVPPRFGDARPHPWDGRDPSAYPVHGSDVSRWQTAVDWPTARANGVNFVFVKATEGNDDSDPAFRDHWRGARAAGIATGAYHFWYHCAGGAGQARNFIRTVPRAPGALPPVLDLEWTPFSPTCTRRTPQEELLREAQVFIDAVHRHYGKRPLVYVSPDIYRERELWRLRGVDFWLRSVAGHPSRVYPGQRWLFWQYSGTALIPGIAGRADANVFAGSAADWAAWRAQQGGARAPRPSRPP